MTKSFLFHPENDLTQKIFYNENFFDQKIILTKLFFVYRLFFSPFDLKFLLTYFIYYPQKNNPIFLPINFFIQKFVQKYLPKNIFEPKDLDSNIS